MKTKYSFTEKNDKLWVACCECAKGKNGDESCSGGRKKKFDGTGCFCGELLSKFTTVKTWEE